MSAGPHIFWITSRAAGVAALVASSLSVGLGLALRGGSPGRSRGDYRAVHEILSLCTLAMVGIHGVSLLGDGWLRPGLGGIAIPFASPYRPAWTAAGIVGGYGLAALGLSYYARDRIGQARWRQLHRLTAVFWMLAVAHSFGSGTDGWQAWFVLVALSTAAPGLALLGLRWADRLGGALELPRSEPPVRHPSAGPH